MVRCYARFHDMPKTSRTNSSALTLTDRDFELLAAIDRTPLTTRHLMTLAATFARPFADPHHLRRRLRQLKAAGYVNSWPCAIAEYGRSPGYFKLTRTGYRLLHGDDCVLPKRRHFEPVSPAQHYHMLALADVLTRLLTLASQHGVEVRHFARENTVRIEAGQFVVYPDSAFQLAMPDGRTLNYFLELDRGTERVRTKQDIESIERKVRAYDQHNARYDARDPGRPMVLFVTTRSQARVTNILNAANAVMANPKRTVFLAASLKDVLDRDALTSPIFRDNRGLMRQLVPVARPDSPLDPCHAPLKPKLANPFPATAPVGVL